VGSTRRLMLLLSAMLLVGCLAPAMAAASPLLASSPSAGVEGAAASVGSSGQPDSAGSAAVATTIQRLRRLDLEPFLGRVINSGNPATGMVALTFDDGSMNEEDTLTILRDLTSTGSRATFFMVGERLAWHPNAARAVLANGSEIGNHTTTHASLVGLGEAEFKTQVLDTQDIVFSLFGWRPKLLRSLGGGYDDALLARAAANGIALVNWNVDSGDTAKTATSASILANASQAQPGSIVLMHETKPETVQALPAIISALQGRGLKLVTVSELLAAGVAAPAYVRSSNPIAYDLKSLLTTRFTTKVYQAGVNGVLSIATPKGPVYLYRGGMGPANTEFFFPLWNGKAAGKRLPPASYEWTLTLSKPGMKASVTKGKILISNITFTVNGVGTGKAQSYKRYMIKGSANCYIAGKPLSATLTGPGGYSQGVSRWLDVPTSRTTYLRGARALKVRSTRTTPYAFTMAAPAGGAYRMSVVQ